MTPKKFKKICKRYFTDSAFTMEDISNVDDVSIVSIFFGGYGILRYCGGDDKEKPYLLLADKFKYSEKYGKILPCRNDGSFIGIWNDYKNYIM